MSEPGIRIEVTDLKTGERETTEIVNDYVVIAAGDHYVSNTQVYPKSGTHVITIKKGGADG